MKQISVKISLAHAVLSLTVLLCLIAPGDTIAGKYDAGNAQKELYSYKVGAVLFADNFDSMSGKWSAEFEQPATSFVKCINGKMDLCTSAGATVWFNRKLSGNIMITYKAIVIDSGGVNDRVSDLNAFWMAKDPLTDSLPVRNGKFFSYNNINLYYAGVGGNDNSTTRFRKYTTGGVKPVIKEYLDKPHLLSGNKVYTVKIVIMNSKVQYYLDNELYFDYVDSTPYTEGYFGFRTTISHQQFSDFKIYRIENQ